MHNNQKNTVLCVLGMHRSGTSMLMKLLNICGVYIGEEDNLFPASPSNKKGHWENLEILRINEEILKRFGGSEAEIPKFPDNWEKSPLLDDLQTSALKLVKKMNCKNRIWGFKEPRTCITLPFWKKIIPTMVYIIPIRDAMDVAKSMNKRNEMPIWKGLSVWSRYWIHILKNTKGERKIFTIYNNYFENWQKELTGLLNFIEKEDLTYKGKENIISDFISPSLRHNKNERKNHFKTNEDILNKENEIKYLSLLEELDNNFNTILKSMEKEKNSILYSQETIKEKDFDIKMKDKYIEYLLNSTSWKITKPLRTITSRIKKILPHKIKILFIVPYLTIGGSEKVLYDIINNLGSNYESFILTTIPNQHAWYELFKNKVKNITNLDKVPQKKQEKFLIQYIIDNKIDIIHISNSQLAYEKLPKIKEVLPDIKIIDLLHIDNDEYDFLKVSRPYDQYINKRITVNKYLKSILIKEQNISPEKISVIYNGIDFDFFNPDKFNGNYLFEEFNIPNNKKIIGFIGRLCEQKQPLQFVKIINELKNENIIAFMASDGELMDDVKNYIDKNNLNNIIFLLGNRTDIGNLLKIMDILIMPSLNEGLPIVALEASAMKVPIIASNVNGLKDIIKNKESGFLSDPNELKAFSENAKLLLKDSSMQKQMGILARKNVITNFSIKKMIRRYKKIYKQL